MLLLLLYDNPLPPWKQQQSKTATNEQKQQQKQPKLENFLTQRQNIDQWSIHMLCTMDNAHNYTNIHDNLCRGRAHGKMLRKYCIFRVPYAF